jgi:hypothetical protein
MHDGAISAVADKSPYREFLGIGEDKHGRRARGPPRRARRVSMDVMDNFRGHPSILGKSG